MRSAALLFLFLGGLMDAQQPVEIDFTAIGPKVGETAADFELRDQHGTPRRLSSIVGPKGAMLVFFRSADW
jgi:hypothetical protein